MGKQLTDQEYQKVREICASVAGRLQVGTELFLQLRSAEGRPRRLLLAVQLRDAQLTFKTRGTLRPQPRVSGGCSY